MWVMNFVVVRDGERNPEDGAPREFSHPGSPFPVPDIDQTVIHRGETFAVDDVIWDLERKSVTVEIVPMDERETDLPQKTPIEDDDLDLDDDELDLGDEPEPDGLDELAASLEEEADPEPRDDTPPPAEG